MEKSRKYGDYSEGRREKTTIEIFHKDENLFCGREQAGTTEIFANYTKREGI